MKAILVIDLPQHLLNSDKYYAEVNIKPKDRKRNWHEKTVEAELKPLPTKKDMYGGSSYDVIESRGYNMCIDDILISSKQKKIIDDVMKMFDKKLGGEE